MAQIIQLDFNKTNSASGVIDIATVQQSCRKLKAGLIAPATEEVHTDLAVEHAAEPIKSMDDIIRISQFLIGQKRFRDNMLFIVGINFGLRISDLRSLRFTHIINDDCTFRDRFPILEKKTRNTRKHQRNRYITINTAVVEAVTLYLENTPNVRLSDYMFRSQSNNGVNENKPISKQAVDSMLKGIARDLGLGNRMATHSLRKTFAYHQMVMSGNDPASSCFSRRCSVTRPLLRLWTTSVSPVKKLMKHTGTSISVASTTTIWSIVILEKASL